MVQCDSALRADSPTDERSSSSRLQGRLTDSCSHPPGRLIVADSCGTETESPRRETARREPCCQLCLLSSGSSEVSGTAHEARLLGGVELVILRLFTQRHIVRQLPCMGQGVRERGGRGKTLQMRGIPRPASKDGVQQSLRKCFRVHACSFV